MKLPFVWELDNSGVVSHAIGTHHITENCYKEDAGRYLDGKKHLLIETRAEDCTDLEKLRLLNVTLADGIEGLTSEEQEELSKCTETEISALKQVPIVTMDMYMMMRAGYKHVVSLEETLIDAALKRNIPTASLEKINIKSLCTKLRESTQDLRDMMSVSCKHSSTLSQLYKKIYTAYKKGDGKTIMELVKDGVDKKDTDRNILMANNSMQYLNEPSVVAVGVAHLLFEPTMLSTYRERGIGVKRVQ